ncbi:MAG: hypothetical protein M3Y60_10960, partial [Bacteroidota bacterium]|nr:hypothetical protein [Bacteroidota bacterium]
RCPPLRSGAAAGSALPVEQGWALLLRSIAECVLLRSSHPVAQGLLRWRAKRAWLAMAIPLG